MVSEKVKAMLALADKKQVDLAQHFGMSKQSMQNKMARDSWSTRDLSRAAAFCGFALALTGPDGQMITIPADEAEASVN